MTKLERITLVTQLLGPHPSAELLASLKVKGIIDDYIIDHGRSPGCETLGIVRVKPAYPAEWLEPEGFFKRLHDELDVLVTLVLPIRIRFKDGA